MKKKTKQQQIHEHLLFKKPALNGCFFGCFLKKKKKNKKQKKNNNKENNNKKKVSKK